VEIPKQFNDLTYKIIGICMDTHREMGPGFPEEYYQKALEYEFANQEISFEPQKPIQMLYKEIQVGLNYLDFVIEQSVILEIKSVKKLDQVHLWQVLKYLGITKIPLALLVNFGPAKLEYKRILPSKKIQEEIHSR
jgi:GxxExxY protein